MRNNRIIICIIMFILLMTNMCVVTYAVEKDIEPKVNARSAILIENDSCRILWGKEPHEKRAMASTTKIMTCIVAIENGNLKDKVKVSRRASLAPKVKMYVKPDEEYILEDLLYALMLQSFNDVAIAIAEHVGGSVEEFCQMMTDKAKEIGANNTNYITPNGLDAQEHYSTAYDLAIIARYALSNELFRKIIVTRNYSILKSNGNSKDKQLTNKDAFLDSYEGANGVKTGFTSQAGYCFVGSVEKNDIHLISVVLGSGWYPNRTIKWKDTTKIMNYGYKNYSIQQILKPNTDYKAIPIINGKKESINSYIDGEYDYPMCEEDKVHLTYNVPDDLEAPVYKEQIIGSACLYVNDIMIKKFYIKSKDVVERVNVQYYFRKILDQWLEFIM